MTDHAAAHTRSAASGRQPGAIAAGAILVLYLLWPLLTSTHVEGFSAMIETGAITLNAGAFDKTNLLYPIHAEFFYDSRAGVVFLMRALMRIVGNGDISFRLLVGSSQLLFLLATWAVARRYGTLIRPSLTAAGWPVFLLALLSIPGYSDLGFYFNDNVVSSAFAIGALWLMPLPLRGSPSAEPHARLLSPATTGRGLLAGVAAGYAAVCRPDALMILPILAVLAWLATDRARSLAALLAVTGFGLAATLVVSAWISGVSTIDALRIGLYFDHVQARWRSFQPLATTFVLWIGLPMMALLPLGVVIACRHGTFKTRVGLVALPLLLLAYIAHSAIETRYFYPLIAPFIVIFCALGLDAVIRSAVSQSRPRSGLAVAWMLGAALVWLSPPVLVAVMEGPRLIVGRLWSPIAWRRWQDAMEATLAKADEVVKAAATSSRTVVLTTQINADHFLEMRLFQAGWTPSTASAAWPGCRGFEVWRHGGSELDHVRTENPHLLSSEPNEYVVSLQIKTALDCAGLTGGARFEVYTIRDWWFEVTRYLYAAVPALARPPVAFAWPKNAGRLMWWATSQASTTEVGEVMALQPDQIDGLRMAAERALQKRRQSGSVPPLTYDEVMAQFDLGVWRSPVECLREDGGCSVPRSAGTRKHAD